MGALKSANERSRVGVDSSDRVWPGDDQECGYEWASHKWMARHAHFDVVERFSIPSGCVVVEKRRFRSRARCNADKVDHTLCVRAQLLRW